LCQNQPPFANGPGGPHAWPPRPAGGLLFLYPTGFYTTDDCERSEGYVYLGKDKPQCPQPNGWYKLPNCTAKPTAFGGGPGTIMASWEWGRVCKLLRNVRGM